MGYMRRHAIVVTSFDPKCIEVAHVKALEIFGRSSALKDAPWKGEIGQQMVSSVVRGVMNEELSFFVGPDGSKEGWAHSDEGDARRAEFIAWMRAESDDIHLYWAELFYGDDAGLSEICDQSEDEEE